MKSREIDTAGMKAMKPRKVDDHQLMSEGNENASQVKLESLNEEDAKQTFDLLNKYTYQYPLLIWYDPVAKHGHYPNELSQCSMKINPCTVRLLTSDNKYQKSTITIEIHQIQNFKNIGRSDIRNEDTSERHSPNFKVDKRITKASEHHPNYNVDKRITVKVNTTHIIMWINETQQQKNTTRTIKWVGGT